MTQPPTIEAMLAEKRREAFRKGTCDLVPNNFSDVPRLMRQSTRRSLVLVSVAPPDRHGYFSLGCHAEYVAAMIGEVPFFVEVNHQMPRCPAPSGRTNST